MSDEYFWPDALIYVPACVGIKQFGEIHIFGEIPVFIRGVDGIKVWVNGQPVMFTAGY